MYSFLYHKYIRPRLLAYEEFSNFLSNLRSDGEYKNFLHNREVSSEYIFDTSMNSWMIPINDLFLFFP